jgi:hypothetical protein
MLIFYPSPWSMQNEQILAWKLKVSRKIQESKYLSSKSPGRPKNPNVLAQSLQGRLKNLILLLTLFPIATVNRRISWSLMLRKFCVVLQYCNYCVINWRISKWSHTCYQFSSWL